MAKNNFFLPIGFLKTLLFKEERKKTYTNVFAGRKGKLFSFLKNKLSYNGKSTDIWSQKFSCRHSKISTQVGIVFYFHFFFLSWIYIFSSFIVFFCYLSLPPFLLVLSVGPKNTHVNIYFWKCQLVNLSFFSKRRC